MVKFAHLADCHLGGWKIPEMNSLNSKTFEMAVDSCIRQKVDFILIAGDFFDTAMPSIEVLKLAASKLKELKDYGIPCYLIPGSHDFSASGKTFLDVLHNAGLCINVGSTGELSLYEDPKTKAIISGMAGLKTQREQDLIRSVKTPPLEKYKDRLKIIMLHTTINENKPNDLIESVDVDDLPSGFDYYALGHIHTPFNQKVNGKLIVYPGPLFPNNFSEVEELENGGFIIANFEDGKVTFEKQEIKLKETALIEVDVSNKNPGLATSIILGHLKKENIKDKIVMLRVFGTLASGKTSEVDFSEISKEAEKGGRYVLLKNTSKLESPEFKVRVNVKSENIEEIEKEILGNQKSLDKSFVELFKNLMKCLDLEKYEGETSATFQKRIIEGVYNGVDIENLK